MYNTSIEIVMPCCEEKAWIDINAWSYPESSTGPRDEGMEITSDISKCSMCSTLLTKESQEEIEKRANHALAEQEKDMKDYNDNW